MNYSEPLFSQFSVFLKALGCGVILGILYVAITFFRMIAGEKKGAYIFFDLLFFVSAAFVSFFFMVIFNSGQVRFNLMVAEFIGGVSFHLAFGRYILASLEKAVTGIKKIAKRLLSPFIKFYNYCRRLFTLKLKTISEGREKEKNIEKKSKKITDIRNKHLKNENKSV